MTLESIRQHWHGWATQYGTGLRATTKASSAKIIEIDALVRAVRGVALERGDRLNILEAGCGNGQNCLALADTFPQARFTGVDFIEAMIAAANHLKKERAIPDDRLAFQVGDVLDLPVPRSAYDVVFTDRCLINLNSDDLQQRAISSLRERLKPGGYLLMIENSKQTFESQNQAREGVGLAPRRPAEFNHFFDETTLRPFLHTAGLNLLTVEDFISLHDLVLYILVPMINGGEIDYEHPLVEAATGLNIALSALAPSGAGQYGQNRLFTCRRMEKPV
jgi:SAM-dependent methyltransferase